MSIVIGIVVAVAALFLQALCFYRHPPLHTDEHNWKILPVQITIGAVFLMDGTFLLRRMSGGKR